MGGKGYDKDVIRIYKDEAVSVFFFVSDFEKQFR